MNVRLLHKAFLGKAEVLSPVRPQSPLCLSVGEAWARETFKVLSILAPIALSFLLAGLARENGGLWGHRIFELIRFFLIGYLEQRIPKRKSKT